MFKTYKVVILQLPVS